MKAINQPNFCWYSALTLATIGALNWGLVGVMNFNVVQYLFGEQTLVTKIIYISIGISSLYFIGKAVRDILEMN